MISSLSFVLGAQALFFTGLWAWNNPTVWIPTALRMYVSGLDLSKIIWAQTKKTTKALLDSFKESQRPLLTFFTHPSICSFGVPTPYVVISNIIGWNYSPNSRSFSIPCASKDCYDKSFPYLTGELVKSGFTYDMSDWLQTVTYNGPVQPPLYVLVQSYLYDTSSFVDSLALYVDKDVTFTAITDEGDDISLNVFDSLPESVKEAYRTCRPAYEEPEEEEIPSSESESNTSSESESNTSSEPESTESTESASGATQNDEREATESEKDA